MKLAIFFAALVCNAAAIAPAAPSMLSRSKVARPQPAMVSNSADALEKARFHSVQDETFLGDTKDLEVKLEFDADQKTISLIDTGVGMTKADLINNLGTVAKSGTTNFLEAMADGGDANLIGQFA